MVIAEISASGCLPYLLCVRIFFVCNSFAAKTRVELFFLRELSFAKTFKRVHVLVRVYAFLQQQPPHIFFWKPSLHYGELITPLYQLVKTAQQKINAVDKSQISSENEMYFSVFVAMHLISPRTLAIACISRWPS